MYCAHCGTQIDESHRFCPRCGREVQRDFPKEAQEAPEVREVQVSERPVGRTVIVDPAPFRTKVIVIASACVVVAAIAVILFVLLGRGASAPMPVQAGSAELQAQTPAVRTSDGAVITAMTRPSLFDGLPSINRASNEVAAAGQAADGGVTAGQAGSGEEAAGQAGSEGIAGQAAGSEATGSGATAGQAAGSEGTAGGAAAGQATGSEAAATASDGASAPESANAPSSADSGAATSSTTPTAQNEPATTPSLAPYAVEPGLANVVNVGDMYLSPQETALLEQNGFAVEVGAGGDEFFEEYEVNRYAQQPNFVTVDSMMHTYHLYFSYLMKTTERTGLVSTLAELGRLMLEESSAQYEQLKGTEWEEAAARNVGFFAVGAALLDPSVQVPSDIAPVAAAELELVQAASGILESPLMGGMEDYSQYAPRGYYEGDPTLESYFRAMMWYGRLNFTQSDESLDRSALLMVIAMNGDALSKWKSVYAITSFFAGASDDCGYYEYYPIAKEVYGKSESGKDNEEEDCCAIDDTVFDMADLIGDEAAWKRYHELTAAMPAPKINSVVVFDGEDDDVLSEEKGFRFMGQRFSIDASIFQQLIYSRVGENPAGERRMLPDALDVPAALGSDEALSILEGRGATSFEGYSANMQQLRQTISEDDKELWDASLYSQWLLTLNPLLQPKGEGYPMFMQSQAWTRKNLQSYLGSYTELKHDTVLYSKQAIAEMGGGNIPKDDRGYVEPEPEVFSRLARLTQATSKGLSRYGLLTDEDAQNLALLQELAERLSTIASKELAGELPNDDEFELIRTYGGQIEHFWTEVYKHDANGQPFKARQFPAAIVTDVATDPNGTVLELGTGKVSTIKVIVPVDGSLRIAEGTVFSFYQFEQPLSNRLTDTEWRQMLGSMSVEDWTNDFQYKDTRYSS